MICACNEVPAFAGQAVVQFAYGRLDRQEYALKFFLSRKAFDAEEALYRHTTLGTFLPQVIASVPETAGSIRDPWGRALPACMVMERGESLDLWMERAQPDKYMAFSVRALLQSLHASTMWLVPCHLVCVGCSGRAAVR